MVPQSAVDLPKARFSMDYRFDFDDQLPDLPTAFDLEAVSEIFTQKWPGHPDFAGTPEIVKVDRLQDVKYRPAEKCVTTYELQVEHPDVLPWQTIGVLEIMPQGVIHRLYDADPKLPWLPTVADPEDMLPRFAALLSQKNGSSQIESFKVTTVRYKPGLHCVFRYDIDTTTGRQVFYGKLFSEEDELLTEILPALYKASEEIPEMPRIPQPLIYWPDVKLLVQPAVARGVELRNFSFDSRQERLEREHWMRVAGANTAALHQADLNVGHPRTFEHDLHGLTEYSAMMANVNPKLDVRYKETIALLASAAKGLTEPLLVPSHGALRTDQFIIQDDHLVMIDIDSFCWSNPARDLGNYLAYMCWKAIRQPEHGEFVEEAGRIFLDGYISAGGIVDDRWLTLYQAASLLKIAGRRFRSLTFREWPLVPHLIDAAIATIEEIQDDSAEDHDDLRNRQILHLSTATSTTKFPAVFIDTEFPALWYALNAEMMSDNIAPLLTFADCLDQSSLLKSAKLLAYKPGKRGVIRYEAEGKQCNASQVVFGKLYPAPQYAERAYNIMKSLNDEVFNGSQHLGIPQPLGCIPELSMLVFIPAEGELLGDLIINSPRANAKMMGIMDLASTWLSKLHQHHMPLEKQFQVANEIDNIHEWADLVSEKYPEETRAAGRIADYLIDRADRLPFDNTYTIHKDFHYEHILVNSGLKVFDFDEIRKGDPNLDLAHFCANFFLLAYRTNSHPAKFARLQQRFLSTYQLQSDWKLDERFIYFYAYSCLKLAKQICKKRGPRPWPEGDEQRAQVWLMLEQGLTTLKYMQDSGVSENFPLPIVDFARVRRTTWSKATRISKSATYSVVTRVSHKHLS